MPLDRIIEMLRRANTEHRSFPATITYNEGWLLRLVLDWFSKQASITHELGFAPSARWFSEALLPSQFFARHRPDRLAEGWTHADGVIGHLVIGDSALANTKFASGGTQLVVTEAKLFSPLSPRVTNAAYFDQAARNVACISEILFQAGQRPAELSSLAFYVIAPLEQVERGSFKKELAKDSIRDKLIQRVSEYPSPHRDQKEKWLQD